MHYFFWGILWYIIYLEDHPTNRNCLNCQPGDGIRPLNLRGFSHDHDHDPWVIRPAIVSRCVGLALWRQLPRGVRSLGSLGSFGAWVLGSGHGHQTHIELASSKRLQKLWKIRVLIGEFNYLTISMAIFNSELLNYQRVYDDIYDDFEGNHDYHTHIYIYIQAYVVDIIQFWNLVFRKKDHLVIFDWVARLSR